MKVKEKILTILFLVILLVSGTIRFLEVSNYNTPITFDQARDLLDIRVLGNFYDLAIFGPTTSINGLRLGPFYYYFNLPAYWLGGGNPMALVNWNILAFLVSGAAIFGFFRKRNITLGFLISTMFLMAPQLFNVTRYFWNANAAAYLSVYYFLALVNFLEKKDKKSILLLGLAAGLLTQFEAAFGIVCLLFSVLLVILNNRKIKSFVYLLIGIIPSFIPQILLEIKNNFQMTKLLLGIFTGSNNVLGEKLAIGQVITLHWRVISQYFEGQFILPPSMGILLLILAIILILVNKKYRKLGIYFLSFLIFAWVFYTVIYHHELKVWYLESLRVWYCFVIGIALANINKYKKLSAGLITIFLTLSYFLSIKDQRTFIVNKSTDDPKNLANLISNIDWVYEKTEGKGFRAYNYVPEVYDYPNEYLYWWYGIKKYGYIPEKISYSLAEIPEYFRMPEKFYGKAKISDDKTIALIYETKSSYIGWLNQFKDYCPVIKKETNWHTTLEIREKCQL